MRMSRPIPLQGPKIIGITEFLPQLLEELPIIPRAPRPDAGLEKFFQVGGDLIVAQQRVVHVKRKTVPGGPVFLSDFFAALRFIR